MTDYPTDDFLDGNSLAGPLTEVFISDVSSSMAVCAGCGRSGRIAELRVYGGGPGLVGRCPGCSSIMLRYATTPHGQWLDLRGMAVLRMLHHTGDPQTTQK